MRSFLAIILLSISLSPVFAQDRAAELRFLRAALPESLIQYGNLEVVALRNLDAQNENGNQFLELRMFPGQQILNKGNRSELTVNFPHEIGDTIEYNWRLRLPSGSETDAPNNRWWILTQWHDQPDPRLGQTWADYPDRSPPVSLGYGVVGGRDVITFAYGSPEQKGYAIQTLPRDVWHNLRAVIHWSTGAGGKAEIYLNDMNTPFGTATGPNMHNEYQHFMKMGNYRHSMIQVYSQIHVDGVSIRRLD